jgi:nucleoside-diphosphate-sugar epimerase
MENRFHRVTPYAARRLRELLFWTFRETNRWSEGIRQKNVSTSRAGEKRGGAPSEASEIELIGNFPEPIFDWDQFVPAALRRNIRAERTAGGINGAFARWAYFHGEISDVRVLVLGGTGWIGSAVVRELIARGHAVFGLARSQAAAAMLSRCGATPIAGDIGRPETWTANLPPLDAVVHAACDFSTDMAAIDRRLLDVLLPALAVQPNRPRFVYTGGCWLFGAAQREATTEASPFNPLPAFAWMEPQLARVLAEPGISGIVIHPAMVYANAGGVFSRFAREAAAGGPIRLVGSEAVRWPLVHGDDLAALYALALEHAPKGASYIGAAVEALPVGRIARAFAKRFGTPQVESQVISPDAIAAELGEWARGRALDQRLSGGKARRDLGWQPRHLDPEAEIAAGA